jgi:hypothetical protein
MKRLFLLSLTLIALLAVSLPASAQRGRWDDDLPERDEFHQTYQMSPGARVELRGINGGVEIETAEIATAQVDIVRSARTREDLEFQKIIVEHTPTSLIVRGEKDRDGGRGRNREVRQRVNLRIPRQVEFVASGINGRVRSGEIDGSVNINGINGSVEVAQARGYASISGVNGRVVVTIANLGERGIDVSGINGGVEVKFTDNINADLDVTGCNGSVYADMPNVTILGKLSRQNFRARIGEGGARITVSGVNGRVRLSRAGASG